MDVVWLGDPACHDLSLVGGKAAHLSVLAAAGFRVPPGFCLTANVFERAALRGARGDVSTAAGTLPAPILDELARAYERLGVGCGVSRPRVAVRSSAVAEDSRLASFAGVYDTYLNVAGLEAVAEAVGHCWTSAYAPRAVAYRHDRDLPDQNVRLVIDQFEISLKTAQEATVLQETHNFWIDQRWLNELRQVL